MATAKYVTIFILSGTRNNGAQILNSFISDTSSVYNLDGLEHNTFYHVRARSRNKAGLSDASNIIYLHTTGNVQYM